MSGSAKRPPRPYGAVPRSLWERADLSADGKMALALLLSHPAGAGLSGIFRTDLDADVRELLGFSKKRSSTVIAELQRVGEVMMAGRWVWVTGALDGTPGFSASNPNHVKAIRSALGEAPAAIGAAFRARHPDADPDAHHDPDPDAHPDQGDGSGDGSEDGSEDEADGREGGKEPAPKRPPARKSRIRDDDERRRLLVADELLREAEAIASANGVSTAKVMELASAIPAGNGHPARAFSDPRKKGISTDWIEASLNQLPAVRAQVSYRPPL